jgi:cytidylate kinase
MPTVVALFGKSCVGKSEVAEKLANHLGMPVRHCGEVVKERAAQLSVSSAELSTAEHEAIDAETRTLVANTEHGIVVEGTFLDIVLQESSNVLFIRLTCEEDVRAKRFEARPSSKGTLAQRDKTDNSLREDVYKQTESELQQAISVDTTRISSVEVVSLILEILRSHDQTKHTPPLPGYDRR